MYCEHCGTKIDEDSVFCESCGKRVDSTEDYNESDARQNNYSKMIYGKKSSKKDWLLYIVGFIIPVVFLIRGLIRILLSETFNEGIVCLLISLLSAIVFICIIAARKKKNNK